VAEVSQPSEAVVMVCNDADVVNAVADVLPAATDAANVAKSVIRAALIAIVFPPLKLPLSKSMCHVGVIGDVGPLPVNNEFHCAAVIVSPAATVDIADSPNPYAPAPVPAKWLYPYGSDCLTATKSLYSSSKIVSPAVYAHKII
jgi:hypothetical protein